MNRAVFNSLEQNAELWNLFVDETEYLDFTTPLVSEYLLKQGYQASYPANKKFAICLTHDVDDLYPPFTHQMLSSLTCLKNGDWSGFKGHLLWQAKGKEASPYWNFQKIIELEQKYKAKSTFYFMATARDPKRFRYNIEDLADELKFIVESGWEVGLHGGYYAFNDLSAIKREKQRLEKVLDREVIGYRNHYLRLQVPHTWALLEKCGFKYDSTYGYTDRAGFRNGMCHPFRPYNLQAQQWMGIYELPLHVMESAIFESVNPPAAWELIKGLLGQVERNKGVLTVLWHNNVFSCPFRAGWSELYENILQYGQEKQAWMTSAEEIWRWWQENGY